MRCGLLIVLLTTAIDVPGQEPVGPVTLEHGKARASIQAAFAEAHFVEARRISSKAASVSISSHDHRFRRRGNRRTHQYHRQPIAEWDVKPDEYLFVVNANIIDVDNGEIMQERGVLIREQRIQHLVLPHDFDDVRARYEIKREIDARDKYVIPGMSDIHCHLTLMGEHKIRLRQIKYFDAQRMKNAEEALKSGCTFVRDCGGAAPQIGFLKREIAANRLLGPRIMASNGAISPRGGMWDVGPIRNRLARTIFGGRLLWFPRNNRRLFNAMSELHGTGNDFFKLYFEEKPLYGGSQTSVYKMFSLEQARCIRSRANDYGKPTAGHAMFMKGVQMLVAAKFHTIEHLTCDKPYTPAIAEALKEQSIAVVPTVSLGCLLSMNCGRNGYPDDPEVVYFQKLRRQTYEREVAKYVIPQLQANHLEFAAWLGEPIERREMPVIGQVHAERVHGFARLAPTSIANLREAGAPVGIGTDGGSGITFCGNVAKEVSILHRYGYSAPELLRIVTLGNMEILGLEEELGSLEVGKYADMVLLNENPLEDVQALEGVLMVFLNGRLCYRKD